MMTSVKFQHTVLVMALAAVYPLSATAAVSAGVAQFIAGDVNVRRPDGGTAPLAKGKDIESGESILTGVNGRAQVKFTDGGLISLQPNTEFKIANYSDNAANPKEERFLVDLLRGSMRAITGLIGKRNRENYKVTTTTATIGIRGSGFNVGYNPDGSLGVTTELDAIEVCNAGGCVGLTAGESVRVVSSQEAPVRTNTRAAVPTPASPEQEPTVAGNQSNSDGKAAIVQTEVKIVNSGTFTTLATATSYNATTGGATFAVNGSGNTTVLDNSKLKSFSNPNATFASTNISGASSLGTVEGKDFIGWGTWGTGTRTDTLNNVTAADRLHYIVGTPTVIMPTTGSVSYNLVGGTAPTLHSGASGTLNSGSLGVNFGTGSVSVTIVTSFGTVAPGGVTIAAGGNTFSDTATTIKGLFVGTNASRAGLVYSGFMSGNGYYSGSAVFQAP
jgi:hypothetical protein